MTYNDPYGEPSEAAKLAVFVQEYIRAGEAPDASVIALTRSGLRDVRYHPQTVADRILAKPEVQAAIMAAKQFYKPAESKDVTTDTLVNDMEALYAKALDERQYPAAINAKKLQAELKGLLVQKVDISHNVTVKTLTDAQLEKIARGGIIEGEFKEVKGIASSDAV